jgi:hypothetical protein
MKRSQSTEHRAQTLPSQRSQANAQVLLSHLVGSKIAACVSAVVATLPSPGGSEPRFWPLEERLRLQLVSRSFAEVFASARIRRLSIADAKPGSNQRC